MKYGICSDLHLEFRATSGALALLDKINSCEAEHILIAGDLHPSKLMRDYFLSEIEKPYTFVSGNHDHYNLKGVYSDFGESLETDLVWATLWTNFNNQPLAELAAQGAINDFRQIVVTENNAFRAIQPRDMVKMYNEHLEFILNSSAQVVMTHFPPHYACQTGGHAKDVHLDAYFVNNISSEKIAYSGKKLWVAGHTHGVWDYKLDDCRLVSNPLGYPGEIFAADEFFQIKIIEL